MMMTIEELCKDRDFVIRIDWSMTQEKAIDMYLEWGAGWTRGTEFDRSDRDEPVYFVIYDWEVPPQVTLLRRNSRDVEELAKIDGPGDLFPASVEEAGKRAGVGVCPLSPDLKRWLRDLLDGPPVPEEV